MKILIADDSNLLRVSIRKFIEPFSEMHQIFESVDIHSTIDAICEVHPDIIILDLSFPDGNGFEVLDFLIEHDLDIMVIVLTNFANRHNEAKCFEKGASFFFDKSHEYEKLEGIIREYD